MGEPALRLYGGDESARDPLTLRGAFASYKLPEIDGRRAPATIRKYRRAITLWEGFCDERASTTSSRALKHPADGGPGDDVHAIRDHDLDAFARWCRVHRPGGAGLSVVSVETTWSLIRSVLRRIGPRETGNPRGEGLLERLPVMDTVADLDGYGDASIFEGAADITAEQLGRLYDACSIAQWPSSSIPAPTQWRGYLVLGALLGMRVENLVAAEAAWFHLHAKSPAKGSSRRHAAGWLRFVPEKTKRSKAAWLTVPLPPSVRSHVEPLIRPGRPRLFNFGAKGNHSARRQWQAIAAEAGCPGLKRCDLRDATNQIWGAVDRDLGRWVCGHAARDVNERHYTRIEPDLIAAIPRLEIPEPFNRRPDGQHQQTLF